MVFDAWKRRPDQGSLSRLLESVEPRVERICRKILKDPHDAEEAKQEVLLEIASGLDTVVDASHFDRWVGKVAFRTALDRRRMRLRRIAREQEAAGRVPNGATRDDALHESMSRLDEGDRELLIERYFDRRTLREMGERRGISAVAARKRLAGAQDRLKRMLGSGIVLVFGASAVKAKTAAVLAVVLIPLLLLGGGAWIAAERERKSTQLVIAPTSVGRNLEASVSESKSVAAVEAPSPGPSAPTAERRRQWTLEKLREYGAVNQDFQENGRVRGWRVDPAPLPGDPQARTPLEKTELELIGENLFVRLTRLRAELEEHANGSASGQPWALFDPMTCLEFLKTPDGLFARSSLLDVIRPSMEPEIVAEDSPSGPLLDAVLPYAHGSSQDRQFLLFLTKRFKVANQAIGDSYFLLLNDPIRSVRWEALASMVEHSGKGNLKSTFTSHVPVLLQLALEGEGNRFSTRDRWSGDESYVKKCAFEILAIVESPEIDEFLVQQMEAGGLQHAQTLSARAPRVFTSHAPRAAAVVRRLIDASTAETSPYWTVWLCAHLPVAEGVDSLRYLGARLPRGDHEAAAGLESIIGRIEHGEGAGMIKDMEKLRYSVGGKDFLSTFPKLSSPTSN